ncbi:MAG TPA: DNA polymerase II large subunit [Candidatus Bathyarchaeia archaeon]|nr:DNA polymerase II large subunit [Candidatus Bathyarchaeia archaeon]
MQSHETRPESDYVKGLHEEYERQYAIATLCRGKGLDPSIKVESQTTYDLADRVEKAVGPPGVAARIRELNNVISREETALKISEEIVLGRFGSFDEEEAAERAVRTALAVLDEAVTVAPIQGIYDVKIRTNPDRTKHLAVYFAGPMRSAGGTEMGLTMIVADHVRRKLNLQPYRATEQEARRFVEELRLYERMVARFQYRNPDDVLHNTMMSLPIEPNGVETDPVEVVVNRNLPRIETNRVRGGALRVVNDGLLGRSTKVLRIVERLGLEGWDWLAQLKTSSADGEEAKEFMFMEDVVGGRPIFAFPSAHGGFRIRYGHARNTGLASVGVHPCTMEILGGFLAVGVQLKMERPGKAGIVTAVDSIEPPVVKLTDGSVLRVGNVTEAKAIKTRIEEILFIGDLMVGYGEFLENNRILVASGFVEEWWAQLLTTKLVELEGQTVPESLTVPFSRLKKMVDDPLSTRPTAEEALEISRILSLPLHPFHTWFWDSIKLEDLKHFHHRVGSHSKMEDGSMVFSNDERLKTILERLCLPHKILNSSIIVDRDDALIVNALLGAERPELLMDQSSDTVLDNLSKLAGFPIKNKAPVFVGARMGRPEKAKERVMTPRVHSLFPTGQFGGSRRDIVEASKKLSLSLEIMDRICPECDTWEPRVKCPVCGSYTVQRKWCPRCGQPGSDVCGNCNLETVPYHEKPLDLDRLLDDAAHRLSLAKPTEPVKGVKGLINKSKTPEPLEKGILRSKNDVSVFKDGTVRFDATNAILTHFRPREIGLSIEEARLLGYTKDVEGKPLESPDQLCPLELQDLVVPEVCALYLVKVSKFLDDLLTLYYGQEKFYGARSKEDLIGRLVVGLSPHTSVGVVARIIGFTKASVCYAHPFWHAAKRRDCDGDEDSVSLLFDVLLNFSREFMPDRIGGLMDAPLLLSPVLNPSEVARQALNIETVDRFPVEFYEKTLQSTHPKDVENLVPTLNVCVGNGGNHWHIGLTHSTLDLDDGRLVSSYKELPTMLEKVKEQLRLADQIVAVKAEEVAVKVLSTHILRDLVGNLRTFTSQRARCTKCGWKPRRAPLGGKCYRCGGKLTGTVFRSGVEKYLDVATEMVARYNIREYYRQRLGLIKVELSETFKPLPAEKEAETQQKLLIGDFA